MWPLRQKKTTQKDETKDARDLVAGNPLVVVALLSQSWR